MFSFLFDWWMILLLEELVLRSIFDPDAELERGFNFKSISYLNGRQSNWSSEYTYTSFIINRTVNPCVYLPPTQIISIVKVEITKPVA